MNSLNEALEALTNDFKELGFALAYETDSRRAEELKNDIELLKNQINCIKERIKCEKS